MADRLITIASFGTSAEAAVVRGKLDAEGIPSELDGEAMASWFGHYGTAIGGVKLLVNESDAQRALAIIESSEEPIAEAPEVQFEDGTIGTVDEYSDELPEDLTRAFRAALIGLILCPPILNLYSIYLLGKNDFFPGHRNNWRFKVCCLFNLLVFLGVVCFLTIAFSV